jgi:hypothetical protein
MSWPVNLHYPRPPKEKPVKVVESPVVKRAREAAEASRHICKKPADPTLGDKVVADRRIDAIK